MVNVCFLETDSFAHDDDHPAAHDRSSRRFIRISSKPHPTSTISSNTSSPLHNSDNDIVDGGENGVYGDYGKNDYNAHGYDRVRSFPADNQSMKMAMDASSVPSDLSGSGAGLVKKKRKKSKMHECTVCSKKFPR